MTGVFVGGDVLAMLAVSRQLGADATETTADAQRLAADLAGIVRDIAEAAALSPMAAARVATRAGACEAGVLALALQCGVAGELLAQHCHLLEEAAIAAVVGGGLVRTLRTGPPAAIPIPAGLTEVRSEEISATAGFGVAGTAGSVRVTETIAADGRSVWLVSRRQDGSAGADVGTAVDGVGSRIEAARGVGATAVWAFASLDDAKTAAGLTLTAVGAPVLGPPSTLIEHRTLTAAVASPVGGAGLNLQASSETGRDGSRALELAAGAGGMALLPVPALLPQLPANSSFAARVEAPAGAGPARLVITVTSDAPRPTGTGISLLDAGNREVDRTTRVLSVDLTDPEDREAARSLAARRLDEVTVEDVATAVRLLDEVDPAAVVVEIHHAVGIVQHADAAVSMEVGASAGASIEVWEATG